MYFIVLLFFKMRDNTLFLLFLTQNFYKNDSPPVCKSTRSSLKCWITWVHHSSFFQLYFHSFHNEIFTFQKKILEEKCIFIIDLTIICSKGWTFWGYLKGMLAELVVAEKCSWSYEQNKAENITSAFTWKIKFLSNFRITRFSIKSLFMFATENESQHTKSIVIASISIICWNFYFARKKILPFLTNEIFDTCF